MAISYSDFLTQVRNYTEVDSNVLSDTIIGQFIRNTELNVAGAVDYDDTRKYATSSFTANKRYLVTPADFLVIRSLQVFADTSITSARTFLEKRDTSFISEFNGSNTTGLPKYYANWDDASIVVAPTPDQAYKFRIHFNIMPALLENNDTNYISMNFSNGLLYCCLSEALVLIVVVLVQTLIRAQKIRSIL